MSRLKMGISMSLDGYVAGPDQSLDEPLGKGGEQLHEWVFGLAAWRQPHGLEGGEVNESSVVIEEAVASAGATIMGRNMFGGQGRWEDQQWNGWWGEDPPFHHPVFVLTHHPREPLEMQGGTTFHFVTDGIESALRQARDAAGGEDVASRRRRAGRTAVPERRPIGRAADRPCAGDPGRRRAAARQRRPGRQAAAGRRDRRARRHAPDVHDALAAPGAVVRRGVPRRTALAPPSAARRRPRAWPCGSGRRGSGTCRRRRCRRSPSRSR